MEALFKQKNTNKKRANQVKVGMNPCLLSGFVPFPSSCLQSSVTPGCWKSLQGRSSAQELAGAVGTLWDPCPGSAASEGLLQMGLGAARIFRKLEQLSGPKPCTEGSGRGAQVAAVWGCGCPRGFPVA